MLMYNILKSSLVYHYIVIFTVSAVYLFTIIQYLLLKFVLVQRPISQRDLSPALDLNL